jgi:hypothetical protein
VISFKKYEKISNFLRIWSNFVKIPNLSFLILASLLSPTPYPPIHILSLFIYIVGFGDCGGVYMSGCGGGLG